MALMDLNRVGQCHLMATPAYNEAIASFIQTFHHPNGQPHFTRSNGLKVLFASQASKTASNEVRPVRPACTLAATPTSLAWRIGGGGGLLETRAQIMPLGIIGHTWSF